MPYTYLIGWSTLGKFYYGVRYSRYSSVDDLWTTYKTSSKYVKEFYAEHGEPDIIQVRKEFLDKESAILWESKVLRRMKVCIDCRFLNRWDNNMIPRNLDGPFPFQLSHVQDKVDHTLVRKYGRRGSGSPSIKKKVEDTNLRRYGVKYTTHLDHVAESRENACVERWGVKNPFMSKEFQESLTNPMHDEETRYKHKKSMENKDWSERNEKSKRTNIEKYGTSDVLNSPEMLEKRKKEKVSCPICNGKMYDAGNFTKHMTNSHGWDKQQAKEYRRDQIENQKDSD